MRFSGWSPALTDVLVWFPNMYFPEQNIVICYHKSSHQDKLSCTKGHVELGLSIKSCGTNIGRKKFPKIKSCEIKTKPYYVYGFTSKHLSFLKCFKTSVGASKPHNTMCSFQFFTQNTQTSSVISWRGDIFVSTMPHIKGLI